MYFRSSKLFLTLDEMSFYRYPSIMNERKKNRFPVLGEESSHQLISHATLMRGIIQ